MKIRISQFSKAWKSQFELIKSELHSFLPSNEIIIEHFGSTSVENLSAKPIIDIMIGVKTNSDLDKVINPLIESGYIYYEKYNSIMPNRRFFIKLKKQENNKKFKSIYTFNDELPNEEINDLKIAHIHVWIYNSFEWTRHLAVRDYLRINDAIKTEYQALKNELGKLSWEDGMAYNKAKNQFMIKLEKEALNYYNKK